MVQNNALFKGVAIGIGVAILVPVAIATLAPVIKPLARSAMKAGIRVYEKGRESLEAFGETIDDMVAEVEEEMVDSREVAEAAAEAAEVAGESITENNSRGG